MMKYPFLSLIFLLFIISSCSSSDDTPNPPQNNVTYTTNVKSIIDGRCLNCHGNPTANNAPMSLTTFAEVKDAVSNRGLIGRIENGSMPLGGTALTAAQVKIIKDWKAGNYPQ